MLKLIAAWNLSKTSNFSAHLPHSVLWHPLPACLAPNLTPCSSDAARGVCRESARFRQARKPLPACGRLARPARRCTPRPSRRFAMRTMEQFALAFPGTIAFSLHMLWRTACFDFLLLCPRLLSRPSARSFPSWPGTAPFRSCLSMPRGHLCHAGGWHLRRKPRAVLLLRLPACLFDGDVLE